MNYAQQRVVAIVVAVVLGMLGAISLANADTLGLTPRIVAWLTIVSTGLGILQSFLPRVTGSDQQPAHIANRIMDLTPVQRRELRELVDRKHAEEESAT